MDAADYPSSTTAKLLDLKPGTLTFELWHLARAKEGGRTSTTAALGLKEQGVSAGVGERALADELVDADRHVLFLF
ncbi:hypothetical protein [Phenylobacterium montanum]|uniref:Uncharacterized protein n=1 Tax=Phenylobacterium montanum TaxID=2823693 RepID=A0A975G487_9CAUL|nr:hypothetical protein [Caulobacter sp. S6]QUD90580.1 hypothetical protein KCG34_12265 [Caulobacter sp. S6]